MGTSEYRIFNRLSRNKKCGRRDNIVLFLKDTINISISFCPFTAIASDVFSNNDILSKMNEFVFLFTVGYRILVPQFPGFIFLRMVLKMTSTLAFFHLLLNDSD